MFPSHLNETELERWLYMRRDRSPLVAKLHDNLNELIDNQDEVSVIEYEKFNDVCPICGTEER